MNASWGLQVHVVDPGTVIGKDAEGQDMVVTDENAVMNGFRMWVTKKVYAKLQEKGIRK
jgi:hypothetical protein